MNERTYWRYNLPGFGYLRVPIYPYAEAVVNFLEKYNHISVLKEIDQLGPIRQVLPGAHHTRFEYLMAQWAIITELCQLSGPLPAGISLSRTQSIFGSIDEVDGLPSHGEVLMVLALLGNIGHLPSTFSGERALIKYLRDTRPSRAAFRKGLPAEDRILFDSMLEENDVYRFNYVIALFLLDRYQRSAGSKSIVSFCQSIIRGFLGERAPEDGSSLENLWRLYRSIRRLTFLALDSNYAPVPFSLDLASIFISLDESLEEIFLETSGFQNVLMRLEVVMRDTVYLAPEQQLNHARVGDEILKTLENHDNRLDTITALWSALAPDRAGQKLFGVPTLGHDLQSAIVDSVQIAYETDSSVVKGWISDPIGWERAGRGKVGHRSVRFACDVDPYRGNVKVTAGLTRKVPDDDRARIARNAVKQLMKVERRIIQHGGVSCQEVTQNGIALLEFLCTALSGKERKFRFRWMLGGDVSPVARVYGSTCAAKQVSAYCGRLKSENAASADALNEVQCLETALKDVTYRGAIISFAGSVEVLDKSRIVAELDGMAVFLSREVGGAQIMLVEGKNVIGGHLEAKKELTKKFDRLEIDKDKYEVYMIGKKGAYALVTDLRKSVP